MQWIAAFAFLGSYIWAMKRLAGKLISSTSIAVAGGIGLAIFLTVFRNFMLTFLLSLTGSFACLLAPPNKEL